MRIMTRRNRWVLWVLLIAVITTALFLQLKEIFLEVNHKNDFGLSLYTSGGDRISKRKGPLKLLLSPHGLYKNFPNQSTESFSINSLGYRGDEIEELGESQKRVIVTGGSSAFGFSVNDDETFEVLLSRMGDDYQVINAGVVGFLSGQELVLMFTELIDLEPDIVIAYNGWNDWWGSSKSKRRRETMGVNSSFYNNIARQLVHHRKHMESAWFPLRGERIFPFDRIFFSDRKRNRRRLKIYFNSLSEKQANQYLKKIAHEYTSNMIKMRDFLHSRQIPFLVVMQPVPQLKKNATAADLKRAATFYDRFSASGPQTIQDYYEPFLELARSNMKAHGVDFIDVNTHPYFQDFIGDFFFDHVHTNAQGNKVIAKILKERLDSICRTLSQDTLAP